MKKNHALLMALAFAPAVFLSSCVYDYPVAVTPIAYEGYDAGYAYDTWTEASYDAEGFPIYGYEYGRPVYGYTVAGAPIYTYVDIQVGCDVPDWGPAPWFHGRHHYPHGVHHRHRPHHFPGHHRPHHRPHGGIDAPIHKNPYKVMGANLKAQRELINQASARQAKMNVAAANLAARQREVTQRAAAANIKAQQNNIRMVAERQAQMNKAALNQAAAQRNAVQKVQQNALHAQQNVLKAQQNAVRNNMQAQQNMLRAQQSAVRNNVQAQQNAVRQVAARQAAVNQAAVQRVQAARNNAAAAAFGAHGGHKR